MTFVQGQPTAELRFVTLHLVDAATGLIGQAGLTFSGSDIQVAKNDAVADAANQANVIPIGGGTYIYPATVAEHDTLGIFSLRVVKPGCRVWVESYPVRRADVQTGYVVGETVAALRYKPIFIVNSATGLGEPGLTFAGAELRVNNGGGYLNAVNSAGVLPVAAWGLYLYPYAVGELALPGVVAIDANKAGCVRFIDTDAVRPAVIASAGLTVQTEAQAIEAICARWKESWELSQPGAPYALGNEALPTAGLAGFANLTFGAIASKQISQGAIGTRIFERRGIVNVKLFGAVDAGDAPLATLMSSVRDALEGQSIGGANGTQPLWTQAVSDQVPVRSQGWYTKTATVPFTFYERR